MNIAVLAISRPVATTLLAIALVFAGLGAFRLLPLASLPRIDFPTISVTTQLPGASAETMASSVTAPLERFLGHIAGITQLTSSSTLGLSRIIMQFDLDRNIDGAARDVQSAINDARSQLPPNLPTLPTYRKVNPADTPILVLALSSDTIPIGALYDSAATILQQKLSQVLGVGQVLVTGSALPAVRIELNPTVLNNYGIGLPQLTQTIQAANLNRPKGELQLTPTTTAAITAADQLFDPAEYASLIIGYNNNSPVYLKDVGYVQHSIEDIRNAGLFNGKPAVFIVIFKQPGANVIKTMDQISTTLPLLRSLIPAGIDLVVALDKTQTIRVSLFDVELTLLVAIFLVILVTYFFLGSFRAMLIPGITVPLSLLGTFCVMYLLGYSLDNLSFMALIISTGFVVDDAVVVLENISRYIEQQIEPVEAAIRGATEVSFTVVAMSLSLIAIFIPILWMGGLVGRLFREFAVTLSVAILISMVISLTITPMMCARILRHQNTQPTPPKKIRLHNFYAKTLTWSLQHRRWINGLLLATVGCTVLLFWIIPKGFFPQQDTGQINGTIQSDQALSFQALHKKLGQLVQLVKADPAVQHVIGMVGGSNNPSSGSMYITLKPKQQRQVSADEIINRLRPITAKITGVNLYLQAAQDLVIGARQANAQFQYTVFGDDIVLLRDWAAPITQTIRQIDDIVDVSSDQRDRGLEAYVAIDRDSASRLGVSTTDIDSTLYHAFGQSQISTMYTGMNQYHVIMEVAPEYWQDPEILRQLYLTTTSGQTVPLSAVAAFAEQSTLLAVNHQSQSPATTISFNLKPHTSLDKAVHQVEMAMQKLHLPPGLRGAFQGTAQAFKNSLASEPYLLLAALLAVYIVLGMLYENYIHPITILSTLPSAGLGALLSLLLMRTDLSIIAFIGIILLIGIVKKNAIMMIDFAIDLQRNQHKTPQEAIFTAALVRFRPIMMTTCAAMLGALPLILAKGLGTELRYPLGIAIFGGLLLSQLLTLYTTPVIYLSMENVRLKYQR